MSMIGKFAQVEQDRFEEILSDPSSVTELFMAKAPTMEKFFALSDAIRGRAKRMAPGALGASMDRLPAQIRKQLAERFKRLGVDVEAVKSGSGEAVESLLKAMQERLGAMARPSASGGGAAPAASLSLEKDWHAIHYLLCGAAQPGQSLLSQVILGGTEIGEDDLGYGPARYFDAKRTADIARELGRSGLENEMRARFDPTKMVAAELYPGGWEPGEIDNLINEFHGLREFFADAIAHGRIVVTCIT
jgi:Domain of unknown function (DUF1877)